MRSLALAVAAFTASLAAAQPAGFELRPFAARENLDHGYQDWREAGAELAWRASPAQVLLLRGRETERYGLRDTEAAVFAAWPVAPQWNLSFEATGVSNARVLPEWSATAAVARQLGDGWVTSGSWKGARYTTSDVSTATVGLERYFGDFRVGYTGYLSRPEGVGWSPSHRLAASWYGEGLTRIDAGIARGRETENTPTGLITSDVRNVSLSGHWGITTTFALVLDLERQRQGDLYTRKTLRLGARVFF